MDTFRSHTRPLRGLLVVGVTLLVAAGCGEQTDAKTTSDGAQTGTTTEQGASTTSGGDAPECASDNPAGRTGELRWDEAPEFTIDTGASYTAVIKTSEGTMRAELLPEEGPCAVNNFVFLAQNDFYQGVPFHRIIKDFMVQTGDPTGTGQGGPGYAIADDEVSLGYGRGVLAMANAGPDTAGSQFFIVHGKSVELPPDYSIFGKVTEGLDVLDRIANTPVEASETGEPSKPTQTVTLQDVEIEKR